MVNLYQGDCLCYLSAVKSNSVNLVVTSPPYYNAMDYSHWNTYSDYLEWLESVFTLVYDKIVPGYMCCVNISVVIQPRSCRQDESQRLPIPFDFVGIMQKIGYKFLEDIIWVKPEGAAKNRNAGFYTHRQPIQYKPNVVNEYIFVFQKPSGKLIDTILSSYDDSVKKESLVVGDYERSNVWYINPDTNSEHPAPFPIELPNNIIRYYSFIGNTVMDIFMGSGTSGVSAVMLDRNFIGMEINEDYFKVAKQRIDRALDERDRKFW